MARGSTAEEAGAGDGAARGSEAEATDAGAVIGADGWPRVVYACGAGEGERCGGGGGGVEATEMPEGAGWPFADAEDEDCLACRICFSSFHLD